MAIERTLSIIKPDAVAKNVVGQILARFEGAGLKIVAARMAQLSRGGRRTLATLQPKPVTAGLGFTHGFLPDLMPEPHDMPLDALLNDNGVVWPFS